MQRHDLYSPFNMFSQRQRKGKSSQYGGSLAAFHGARIQRGYGLGSLFGSLARAVLPIFKQGAKTVGKAAVRTGFDIAKDVLAGQNLKTAAKNRARETGTRMVNKAVKSIQSRVNPQTGGGLKRKRKQSSITSTPAKRACTSRQVGKAKSNCRKKQANTKSKTKAAKNRQRKQTQNQDIFGVY